MPNKKTPTKASAKVSKPTKGTTKKVNKTTKPKSHKKDLVFASGPLAFWGADGQILHSLLDLVVALENMPEEIYYYHALGDSNDFSNWVEYVLCDHDCAKMLEKSKSKSDAIKVVKSRIKLYKI